MIFYDPELQGKMHNPMIRKLISNHMKARVIFFTFSHKVSFSPDIFYIYIYIFGCASKTNIFKNPMKIKPSKDTLTLTLSCYNKTRTCILSCVLAMIMRAQMVVNKNKQKCSKIGEKEISYNKFRGNVSYTFLVLTMQKKVAIAKYFGFTR